MSENSQRQGGKKGGQNNLTFIRKLPKFLQHTQQRDKESLEAKFKNSEEYNEEEEEEYDEFLGNGLAEDERPQVVVTKQNKHMSESDVKEHYQKLGKLPKDKVEEVKPEEGKEKREGPSVDANGRILFKSKRQDTTATIDDISSNTNKKQKKSKKLKKSKKDLLSFDLD